VLLGGAGGREVPRSAQARAGGAKAWEAQSNAVRALRDSAACAAHVRVRASAVRDRQHTRRRPVACTWVVRARCTLWQHARSAGGDLLGGQAVGEALKTLQHSPLQKLPLEPESPRARAPRRQLLPSDAGRTGEEETEQQATAGGSVPVVHQLACSPGVCLNSPSRAWGRWGLLLPARGALLAEAGCSPAPPLLRVLCVGPGWSSCWSSPPLVLC
jgi:hypothetical protein